MDSNTACPRCGGRDIQLSDGLSRQPPLFVTPSGFMLTEDALRQIVGANASSLEDAEQAIQHLFRMLHDQGMPSADQDNDLFEVIARSMEEPTNTQPPPASEAALQQLRTSVWNPGRRADDEGQDECGICLSSYEMVQNTLPLF